ncbi:hypothetical protein P8625_03150 [Tenacibaculum tangerinum]|uniref:Outer membrane protein beta-barrel domain-containing protein n=1 Tax=Tenacibaculum tangerinum TaxID=3038772 RepID=A0ABY8L470_9FLAO|nr:hypothetical protein [Tenacibaculum tangerinum]WGH76180.1 hypothetical protein P8625_03150 [Tenacibaculum tangerinum]
MSWNKAEKMYDRIKIPELNSEFSPLPKLYFNEELTSVINYGIGAEIYMSQKMNAYASYSTDFSPFKSNASLFDLMNKQNEDINYRANFHHYGLGLDFSIKTVDVVLGGIFSSGRAGFVRPLKFPNETHNSETTKSKILFNRWRILVGFNISIDKNRKATDSEK